MKARKLNIGADNVSVLTWQLSRIQSVSVCASIVFLLYYPTRAATLLISRHRLNHNIDANGGTIENLGC